MPNRIPEIGIEVEEKGGGNEVNEDDDGMTTRGYSNSYTNSYTNSNEYDVKMT